MSATLTGERVARLIPQRLTATAQRVPGIDKGKLKIADDFDKMSKPEIDEWYRLSVFPK